jgi:hypothetical protein
MPIDCENTDQTFNITNFFDFLFFFHMQYKFISFFIMIDYNNKCFIKMTCGQLINLYDRSSVSSGGHVWRQLGATISYYYPIIRI